MLKIYHFETGFHPQLKISKFTYLFHMQNPNFRAREDPLPEQRNNDLPYRSVFPSDVSRHGIIVSSPAVPSSLSIDDRSTDPMIAAELIVTR